MTDENLNQKLKIDKYIEQTDCKTKKTRSVYLNGQWEDLSGIKLPIDLLHYNIKNGRFAKEYVKITRDEGRQLVSEDPQDAEKIQNLLLSLSIGDNEKTRESIKHGGQIDLAIITRDGYVIDGNRRMAILSQLYEKTGDKKYSFLLVARLENVIQPKDLWAIEANISLGDDPKSKYGPINELLKLDEGKKLELSFKEIAETIPGAATDKDIEKSLARLDLMRKYLKLYYDDDEDFTPIRDKTEHFINLQNLLLNAKASNLSFDDIADCKKVVFRLIFDGIGHMRIRKLNQAIKLDVSLDKIRDTAGGMGPPGDGYDGDGDDDDDSTNTTPTLVAWTDFEDIIKNKTQEDMPQLLLSSIINSFNALKFESNQLKTNESKNLIKKILEFSKKLEVVGTD